ncbi:MAG: mycofactocin biosynthesis glycosyltransferase MftF [Candidatus Competibacteraceae bacterium]
MNPLAKEVLPFPGRPRHFLSKHKHKAAEAAPAHSETAPARYALKPGLELLSRNQGGILLCRRPLLAMRLNRQGFALLSRLGCYRSVAELATRVPDLTAAAIEAFLNNLVHRRLLSRRPPVTGDWPPVSIIIPAHGRPEATRAGVHSLLALDYPADRREIIVVDDASEPPLAPWLADLPVRLLRQERTIGQSAARNLAAVKARGTVLAFIDNDCVAEADWLRTLVPYLDEPWIGIVGGKVTAPPAQGSIAAFEAVRSPLDMGALEADVAPGAPVSYLPTCNLLVRRELLLSQRGFDAGMRLGEDVDVIWRTLQTGVRACYVPAGRIVHDHRVQLGALLRRRADYGSSEADLQRRHPRGRRVMPLPLVSLLLLLALLPGAWPLGLVALGLVGLELIDKQ